MVISTACSANTAVPTPREVMSLRIIQEGSEANLALAEGLRVHRLFLAGNLEFNRYYCCTFTIIALMRGRRSGHRSCPELRLRESTKLGQAL